ncbi:MAG: ABC transporter permease [Lachnospiraceae bacterium]|nr:ABC transporter permease [Lachnospiraceae bacterium]
MEHIKTFWRRRGLLWELVKKGIKLKYRRSYLGILWSFLEPLLTTVVLTIVFGTLLGRGGRDFPVYILCGRLLYSFFSTSTKAASKSIRQNSSMIKKVYVPKYLYPLSSILYNYIITGISLLTLVPLSIYCHVYPTVYMPLVIVPFILLFMLTYGASMILSTVTVFFRDMEYLWDVLLMIIMYTSAIFYYPEKLMNSGFFWILKYNPLYCIIMNFRYAMFGQPLDMQYVLIAAAYGIGLSVIGTYAFYKKQDEFILAI